MQADESGNLHPIEKIEQGYWLWLASLGCAVLTAVIFPSKRIAPEVAQRSGHPQ
jgi:hypothetical protein